LEHFAHPYFEPEIDQNHQVGWKEGVHFVGTCYSFASETVGWEWEAAKVAWCLAFRPEIFGLLNRIIKFQDFLIKIF
jgi:hypothetical protein